MEIIEGKCLCIDIEEAEIGTDFRPFKKGVIYAFNLIIYPPILPGKRKTKEYRIFEISNSVCEEYDIEQPSYGICGPINFKKWFKEV